MANISASIRHNLARLAHFSGRESRADFWPYAILLFLGSIALTYIAMIPAMVGMFTRIGRFVEDHPGRSPIDPDQPMLAPELMPDMTLYIQLSILVSALFVLLIAAAAVRRLHDRDRSGLWALLPLPFWASGWVISFSMDPRAMFAPSPEQMRLVQISTIGSLFAWAALIWLIALLAGEGIEGDNRFGPAPPPAT